MQYHLMKGKTHGRGLYTPDMEHDGCGVGFVANIKGRKSHSIIQNARTMLINMSHRSAVSCDGCSGDGAGVMTAIPDTLLRRWYHTTHNITLPPAGSYAVGHLFLPHNAEQAAQCEAHLRKIIAEGTMQVLAMHPIERDSTVISGIAQDCEPHIYLLCLTSVKKKSDKMSNFERELYRLRKHLTHTIRGSALDPQHEFYICSLSASILVYKGMLTPHQLFGYYQQLSDPNFESHFAMLHSRFSTNTFPSWDRAQPMRCISHNGEINTLRGNCNKMRAREGILQSTRMGDSLADILPVIESQTSDSGSFDNVIELLLLAGYSLPQTVMMMVPSAWENNRGLNNNIRAVYEYMSCMMEPWDGPATISFSDGHLIGALLDRNGLRPSRYWLTNDDRVIMASEVGVLPVESSKIRHKGRLHPGRMFLVDFDRGTIVADGELKESIASQYPYEEWLARNQLRLADIETVESNGALKAHNSLEQERTLKLFGYTVEHLNLLLRPMAQLSKEPLGSMGNDTPLAILSARPKLVYDYFYQLFAQVTNPPIDSIREDLIMSLVSHIGPEHNILEPSPHHCQRLRLEHPVLTHRQFEALGALQAPHLKLLTIDITYAVTTANDQLSVELSRICKEVTEGITQGYGMVILSDKNAGAQRIPISALLATGAVHHHLVQHKLRTKIGLIIESGEPREVHHFCTLLGYGADAIYPYMAFTALQKLHNERQFQPPLSLAQIEKNWIAALSYGLRKVFGKMGISTLESYKGAQIFEIIGLDEQVVTRCFRGTASRIGGATFAVLAQEAVMRHHAAFAAHHPSAGSFLDNEGEYQWRKDSEIHQWSPTSIHTLQRAARLNDSEEYERFIAEQHAVPMRQASLRGLLRFRFAPRPLKLEDVEPLERILPRFATGAMSFGSISQEAHETLAIAMNRMGAKSNTGEGGEQSERFVPLPNGDSRRSAIKQIASGRFGVTIEYLTNADEIQIKMAQGAKPGEGGELPGHKVFDVIARTRYSTPGVGLISPPPHHDIYSIEDIAQLIFDLKNANPQARISVKLVSEVGVGTVAAGVVKAKTDHLLISGSDGGTGASPLTGIKHAGLPWELGLAETHQTLLLNGLRDRVVLQVDGQLKSGRDVVIAALLGAEEYGFSTAPLVILCCIMMRVCHLNTCPVGVATQDERLRKRFRGRADHVVRYFHLVTHEIRRLMAQLGIPSIDELIGRSDLLEVDRSIMNWKSAHLNLAPILQRVTNPTGQSGKCYGGINMPLNRTDLKEVLDCTFIAQAQNAIANQEPIVIESPIGNTDRTAGTMLSNYITRTYGMAHLPEDTIKIRLRGSAGQSFGGWLTYGVQLHLFGDANDYVGKSLSGGTIIVQPPEDSTFIAHDNMIIGNVALYGAIAGKCYIRGRAAERFCVRNSGAHVVVEGVGDHGCEYMTGGRALILGPTGRNFAAGMSGGIAYAWDPEEQLTHNINPGIVEIEALEEEDERSVLDLMRDHSHYTQSGIAAYLLEHWEAERHNFVRVISLPYRQVLELQRLERTEVTLG